MGLLLGSVHSHGTFKLFGFALINNDLMQLWIHDRVNLRQIVRGASLKTLQITG